MGVSFAWDIPELSILVSQDYKNGAFLVKKLGSPTLGMVYTVLRFETKLIKAALTFKVLFILASL